MEINGLTAAQYTDLARILDAYARQNSLKPLAKKDTGANGCAGFDALEPGLYLVGSSTAVLGGKKITVDPFLVSLPGQNDDGNAFLSAHGPAKAQHFHTCGNRLPSGVEGLG